jgi:hypothetical protein
MKKHPAAKNDTVLSPTRVAPLAVGIGSQPSPLHAVAEGLRIGKLLSAGVGTRPVNKAASASLQALADAIAEDEQ